MTGNDLPESGGKRTAHLKFYTGDNDEAQAQEADPNSGDPTSRLVCFHVPSVVLLLPQALINKTGPGIDGSDALKFTAQKIESMSTALWLAENAA